MEPLRALLRVRDLLLLEPATLNRCTLVWLEVSQRTLKPLSADLGLRREIRIPPEYTSEGDVVTRIFVPLVTRIIDITCYVSD